jgi:glyoxylase-like metal-dependent hydrolase (beta-lactamase superfamily II)
MHRRLPSQIVVLERGWLSSNNILFLEGEDATLVDSGYVTHAPQTVALLRQALEGRRLRRLVNTHSHSDHIGGNAAVKREFDCSITIPEGIEEAVANWDEHALMLTPTQQTAEYFRHDATLRGGDMLEMGGLLWEALAVPGHDMHALAFYCADERILVSGDALWRDGFGIIFAELIGVENGIEATRGTLEMLGGLAIDVVIPGHGSPFDDVEEALDRAFQRLAAFESDSGRLARHALKVLFTFMLLEKRQLPIAGLARYLTEVPLCRHINARFLRRTPEALTDWLINDLQHAGVLRLDGECIIAA